MRQKETTPSQDEEFVLTHGDCLEMSGFISHLKLPHYVTFQSKPGPCQSKRRRRNDRRESIIILPFSTKGQNGRYEASILKAVAIPGYQVPFGSRELPIGRGWGTGGIQITLSIIGKEDILKVIDQGSDDSVNAVNIKKLVGECTGCGGDHGFRGSDDHSEPPQDSGDSHEKRSDPGAPGADAGASAYRGTEGVSDEADACGGGVQRDVAVPV